MVYLDKLRALLALHLLFLLHRHGEVVVVDSLKDAFVLLPVSVENLHFLAYKAMILLWHLEGLSQSGGAYLKFVVFFVAAEVVFDVTAQFYAVLYPYAIGMVYLDYDTVVGAYFDVNKEVLLAVKLLVYDTSYGVFVYHIYILENKK